jgi:hypothetical protein
MPPTYLPTYLHSSPMDWMDAGREDGRRATFEDGAPSECGSSEMLVVSDMRH